MGGKLHDLRVENPFIDFPKPATLPNWPRAPRFKQFFAATFIDVETLES